MVRGFFVVGVGSALEEETSEFGMLRDAGGSVDCTFECGARVGVVDHLVPAGVGAGSRIEQSLGGADGGFGA